MSQRITRRGSVFNRVLQALAVLAVAALTQGLLSGQAHAQSNTLVQCAGTTQITYSPGLSNTPQMVTFTTDESFSPCLHVPALPALPSAMTATSHIQVTLNNRTCSSLLATRSLQQQLTWSNGETSTISYDATNSIVNGTIVSTQTGTVTAGRYQGQSVVGTRVWTPLLSGQPLDFLIGCASPQGVTSLSGTLTLTIL